MRIQYLVDKQLDVISGGQTDGSNGGGGGIDVGALLGDLITFGRIPDVAADALTEHNPLLV